MSRERLAYAACAWALAFVGWATNGLKAIAARAIAGLLAIGGVLLALYETAELVQHLLMAVGVIDRAGLDDMAVYGHLLLWDPWWILGGVLFALAGWRSRRVRAPARP
jgi:hypothetical protein